MDRDTDPHLSTDDVYEEMEVLEPYTTGELASIFDASNAEFGSYWNSSLTT